MWRIIPMNRVKIVGMGYVGQTLAASMAESGFIVYGIDNSDKVIEAMRSCNSHVREEGLNECLKKHVGKTLFVGNWDDFKQEVNAIVIAVPTPINKNYKPNLSFVKEILEKVAKSLKKGQLIALRSTVPLGTTRKVAMPILEKSGLKAGKDFYLVFSPERTIQGAALHELTFLPQVIGGIGEKSVEIASELFRKITPTIVPVSSPEAAETIKLIDNSFRDFKFAYANELAELCEKADLNAFEIIRAANRGYQRNNIPLPSPGVGGGCLSKDPHIFADSALQFGQNLTLIKQSRAINEAAPFRIVERLKPFNLSGKTVLINGFAFKGKPPTNDIRISPTLDVVSELKKENVKLRGFDPVVESWKIKELGVEPFDNIEKALENVDVAIFMTNNQEFQEPEVITLIAKMKKGGIIVDGWGLFDKKEVEKLGLKYIGVGVSEKY